MPEIDAVDQHLDLVDSGVVFADGRDDGVKALADGLGVLGLLLRGEQVELAHLPQVGGGGFLGLVLLVVRQGVGEGLVLVGLLAGPLLAGQGLAFARLLHGDDFNIVFPEEIEEFFDGAGVPDLLRKQLVEVLEGDAALVLSRFKKVVLYTRKH